MLAALLLILLIASTPAAQPILILEWPTGSSFAEVDDRLALSINMWNVKDSEGRAVMKYFGNGTVVFEANLWNLSIEDPGGWVLGYPEVYKGYNPWSLTGVYGLHSIKLPTRLDKLPPTEVLVDYTVWKEQDELPINFAFDIWITQEKFSRGVGPRDFELMIWLYSDRMDPAGLNYANLTMPVRLGGKIVESLWELWIANSTGGWQIVTLRSPKPLVGEVGIDLRLAINIVAKSLSELKIRLPRSHYIEGVELGSEFGSPFTEKAKFGWILRKFVIKPLSQPPKTTSRPRPTWGMETQWFTLGVAALVILGLATILIILEHQGKHSSSKPSKEEGGFGERFSTNHISGYPFLIR